MRNVKTMQTSKCHCVSALAFVVFLAIAFPALSATFKVSPSGDLTGVTDQANIKTALEAAKNGGTVELAAGTFYLHKSIVVAEFNGTFMGSGKALTTVQTAPNTDFDLSEAEDLFRSFSPSFGASMFLFPYDPSSEAKTFRMSDMKIVISEPGVDAPLDGFVDKRRPFLLNTMSVLLVTNVDALALFFEKPYNTINLDATVEHLEIQGVQDPRFRRFWDEFSYDKDNSIFDGIAIWGPSTGTGVTAKDVHVVNADIALNFSSNPKAAIGGSEADGCVIENAILGIENFFSPTIALHNEISDTDIAILLIDAPNNRIEANSISGDGFISIKTVRSPNSNISNNFVTGNWVFGINPFDGSDNCLITGNFLGETKDGQKLGMSSLFGAISVDQSNHCTVSGNKFVNVNSPGLGAVWISGESNKVENNNYLESGLPGWDAGPGAIMLAGFKEGRLDRSAIKNQIFETQYPAGTDVCGQVLGIEGNFVQALVGGSMAGVNLETCPESQMIENFNQLNTDLLQQLAEKRVRRKK